MHASAMYHSPCAIDDVATFSILTILAFDSHHLRRFSPCCISQGCKADLGGEDECNTNDDVDMNKWSSIDDRHWVHSMYVGRHACNLKRIAICICCCAADQRDECEWKREPKGTLLQFIIIFLHTYIHTNPHSRCKEKKKDCLRSWCCSLSLL